MTRRKDRFERLVAGIGLRVHADETVLACQIAGLNAPTT